jgi:Cdc6-like AAA superfamily ATPase
MKKHHPLVKDLFNLLLACGYEGTIINSVSESQEQIEIEIMLPYHKEIADLEDLLPNITQEFYCTDYKITKRLGKIVTVLFGKTDLNNIDFNDSHIHPNTLKIELPSSFGKQFLDFSLDSCCHLLIGGTTGMGKSMFLLYVSSLLYHQTNGQMKLYINGTKSKDYFFFLGLPNVQLSKTQDEFDNVLADLINEYNYRDSLLYLPELSQATDAKDVKEMYPHMYKHFEPIFVIIDEYARFADNKEIQKKVTELVESARYVNIHIIIATQRPDARTVLPPRIKANLLTRVCFTTADEANSIIILDQKGAESLGRIAGRALFSNGELHTIQVPKITKFQMINLLTPFKKGSNTNDKQKPKGYTNHENIIQVQNMFKESPVTYNFSEQLESGERLQSHNETPNNGWFRLADTKGKE